MNFGNPERPEIMGQFADCIEGIRAACLALDFPVVSGNVSLLQRDQRQGHPADPGDRRGRAGGRPRQARLGAVQGRERGDRADRRNPAGTSAPRLYLREIAGRREGAPPPVDLAAERRNGDFVRAEIASGAVTACHDLSDGGLLVAAAEMAMASNIGATLSPPEGGPALHAWGFGEDQGRYLVTAADAKGLLARAKMAGVPAAVVGHTGGNELTLAGAGAISVAQLKAAHEGWLPGYMGETAS